MRIIGGELSGRKIAAPTGETTRPMLDRVRAALFNILEHHDWGLGEEVGIVGANVLDLFAGTGGFALEALSRGAARAVMFDTDTAAVAVARANVGALGLNNRCQVLRADALHPPAASTYGEYAPCSLVFADPPYHKELVAPSLLAAQAVGWIADMALIIVKTARKEDPCIPAFVHIELSRVYGDSALHFGVARRK